MSAKHRIAYWRGALDRALAELGPDAPVTRDALEWAARAFVVVRAAAKLRDAERVAEKEGTQ
jgi:predicted protein tyrosine phosphatase